MMLFVAVLAKLDDSGASSRFTTWAYKFVLLEAGVKARRRAWHGREVTLDDGRLAGRAGRRAPRCRSGPRGSELLRGG